MSDYRLTREQYDATVVKVTKANDRAAKRGLAGRLTIEGTLVTVTEKDEITGIERVFEMMDVVLGGEPPRYEGWTFAATLDWDGNAGLIVRTAPGVESVDRTNLVEDFCDHCKTNRYRTETYLLVHDDGRQVQVGSTCIKDFLGIKVGVAWLDIQSITSEFEGALVDRGPRSHGTEYVLALAWALIKLDGYKPASSFGNTTKGDVMSILYPPRQADAQYREWAGRVKVLATEAMERASEVRAFICSDEFSGGSDYVTNLKNIAAADLVSDRNIGFLVSAPQAWARHQERTLVRQRDTEGRTNEYVGTKGDKLTLSVTIKMVRFMEGMYGTRTLYKMVDDQGNLFEWWTTSTPLGEEVGATFTIKGSVKGHEEFKGTKATVLTRCKVA